LGVENSVHRASPTWLKACSSVMGARAVELKAPTAV